MKRIAHLSDLHFDVVSAEIVDAAVIDVTRSMPDLVVVSGDLTQRAETHEFASARAFLDRLPLPRIVVPGNHDIPLFNVVWRFLKPLDRWRKHIGDDLAPFHADDEIAVLGINTARSLTWKNGRVSTEQMALMRQRFCPLPERVFKILVTHHPFLPPPLKDRGSVVGRAEKTMAIIGDCQIDMILAGHFHMSYAAGTHGTYRLFDHSALVIQAGTATSTRTRIEKNSYNLIKIDGESVSVNVRVWDGHGFFTHETESFARLDGRWSRRSTVPQDRGN